MNKRAIWAIARKDIRAIFANVQVWLPMMILPALLGVLLPTGAILGIGAAGIGNDSDLQQLADLVMKVPAGLLKTRLEGFATVDQKVAFMVANFMFAPFFLLIPLMTSSVISADSFAGEKERGTLETLLFAPADLLSLFVGKALAAFLPSMLLSLGTFAICVVTVNAAGWSIFQQIFFPHLNWIPMLLLVIPLVSLLTILLNVFISARVASFQAAYQMGGMVVLPAIGLVLGQMTGVLMLDTLFMLVASLVLAVISLILLRVLLRQLNRNQLFESQVR